jgi:hypothetical protein
MRIFIQRTALQKDVEEVARIVDLHIHGVLQGCLMLLPHLQTNISEICTSQISRPQEKQHRILPKIILHLNSNSDKVSCDPHNISTIKVQRDSLLHSGVQLFSTYVLCYLANSSGHDLNLSKIYYCKQEIVVAKSNNAADMTLHSKNFSLFVFC